jgi:hypothetical protein
MGSITIGVTMGGIIVIFLGIIRDKLIQKFGNSEKALKAPAS